MANYWKKKLDELNKQNANTPSKTTNYWDNKIAELEKATEQKNDAEDIAPVKATSNDERKWFEKGAFEDGYQFGDVTKTILGSIVDLGENIGTGIIGMGEKLVDTGATLGALMNESTLNQAAEGQMLYNSLSGQGKKSEKLLEENKKVQDEVEKKTAEFVAKDLYDEEAVAKKIITEPIKNVTGIDAETDSVLGEKSDSLAQSAGQLGATVALQAVGVPWWLTTGATTFGAEAESSFNQGATFDEAVLSSTISAGAEILTEKISGGIKFGGNTLDSKLTKELARGISNKTVRTLAKLGVDAVGEGGEEILSGVMSAIGQKLTYADDKEMSELFSSEEAFESFIGGAVLGGGFGSVNAIKANKNGIDYASEMNNNEKAVVDKLYNDAITEAEQNGEKLTQKEKSKIYDDILEQMEKGYISTDTIEEALGGETYKAYKNTLDNEEALQNEFNELNRMKQGEMTGEQLDRRAELKQQLAELKETSEKDNLKAKLSEEVYGLAKDTKLVESYNEKIRRGQAFEADLSQYEGKYQGTVKKAVESGILNNSRKTHEFVDFISKISADKGVFFDFTDNENLKNSSFAVDGKTVNGYVDEGGNIVLNINSAKSLNSTAGHEITHILEGTELYQPLADFITEYARTKGEYDSRLEALNKLYEGVYKGEDFAEKVNKELVADLVGDYIFTDKAFVQKLSTENRNIFQKIYDEIKYLCKVATAGSKEARELEKVKKIFADVYRESGNINKSAQNGTNTDKTYSLSSSLTSDNEGTSLSKEQQDFFKDSKMRDDNGNLKVMYHGSQDAGFHIFDAKMSDDDTSFFFVDRNDVAASYSGTTETYEAQTIRTAEDMNNFLASIGYDNYEAIEKDGKFELLEDGEHITTKDTAQEIYEEFCWYEGVGEGDANYKVYLNLTNPLVVDAEGRNWNNISREYSQEIADRYGKLTAEEKAALVDLAEWGEYSVFKDEMLDARAAAEQGVSSGFGDADFTKLLARAYEKLGGANANLYDAFSIASDNFSDEAIKQFAFKQMNTRDYAKKAKAEGYDGVIFKNIHDNGGYSNGSEGASTVAIAFESNQIKSVANEKPTSNADIRYSVSDKNITDVSTGYAYDETYYTMSYNQDGKVVGTLEYGEYEGKPNVKMIEVIPEYRRQGIGAKLLQELQRKYPDQEIDFGMTTPDGTKLLDAITYDVTDETVVADRQKLKDLQSELNELQGKLDVLYDTENLTEAQEAEMHRLGDRWEEVYHAINELEPTLRGKKATKTFVKTDTKYSLSEADIDTQINQSMTMEEAKQMVQRAFVLGGIQEWYEGEYKNGDEWLKAQGADEVAMYIDNEYTLQEKYLNKIQGILDDKFYTSDVLEAYLNGTLTGKEKAKAIRLDTSKDYRINDERFYSPQRITEAKSLYEIANQRLTNQNRAEVSSARAKILLFAHNKGASELLGLTQAELNKKLRAWGGYPASALEVSKRINNGVADSNKWAGIENCSWLNRSTVTDEEIKSLVKSVEGESNSYENKYIARTMLALDTHIDWSWLSIEFDSAEGVNKKHNGSGRVNGFYNNDRRKIVVQHNMPNTVAHEMGHALDYQWARDLGFSYDALTTVNRNTKRITDADTKQFFDNFKIFMDSLTDNSDIRSEYTQDPKEVFARFVAKFIQWVDNTGTGGRTYNTEFSFYNDKFSASNYIEFAKLLQEKAMLDAKNMATENGTYSLSNEGEQIAPIGNYNVQGKDIALETAPTEETITENAAVEEDYSPAVYDAPITEEEAIAEASENLASLGDADAPLEVEEEYYEAPDTTKLDDAALKNISKSLSDVLYLNRKETKAIRDIIQDYSTSEFPDKAELFWKIKEEYGTKYWDNVVEDVAEVRDYLRTYRIGVSDKIKADIKALYGNYNSFRKRYNFKVRLAKDGLSVDSAYKDLSEMFPNFFPEDIWNETDQFLQICKVADMRKTATESYNLDDETIQEAVDIIADEVSAYKETSARIEAEDIAKESLEDIAPLRADQIIENANNQDNVTKEPILNTEVRQAKKLQSLETELADNKQLLNEAVSDYQNRIDRLTDEYVALKDKNSRKANDIVRRIIRLERIKANISDDYSKRISGLETRVEELKQNRKTDRTANVLVEEPTAEKKKNGTFMRFRTAFLDKGSVFEDLALKTKNRKLQAKYNFLHYSEGIAQRLIGKGVKGVKALNDIKAEVESSGKTEEFYKYLYHKHNIDRMNLEDRYDDVENKPVFGDNVTSEVSQGIVNKIELANPEFKAYADDVYTYMNYLRNQLTEKGVISQDTADLWAEMYPHYVPIRRVGESGLNINVALDTNKTGINAPVKKATGGSSDILPLFDTMAMRTLQTFKATAKNSFGVELKDTLGTTIEKTNTDLDGIIDSVDSQESLLQEGKNGQAPTFTVFENGERVTFEITEEMYDALKPTSKGLAQTIKPLSAIMSAHRGVLTEYNPTFMLTNAIKDTQDVLLNSQHPVKTYANFPVAIKEMLTKGKWYTERIENGGEQDTYFEKDSNTFAKEKSTLRKIVGFPLDKISQANNFIEQIPRLAEYIASRKNGASIEEAMLDSARVTTNFAAGGDVTKFLNRNGFTFLNASVQGAMQQVRNVREAKANGFKGWAALAIKTAAAGLAPVLLNSLLWDDDEEYEELSDYVKQNYYVVAKTEDGEFIRIPKGRALAVIQNIFEQTGEVISGEDSFDIGELGSLAKNIAPNNPIDNNIIAPFMQVASNKAWYGEDLVPTRLQDLPAAEQYDESTDKISKWLGENLNYSPYKINYLLNQYSGGVGDALLPYITPEAEKGEHSLLAPLKDKFTTDSTMNNQNISDFYDTVDELTVNANSSSATDEDILKSKYMNSVNAELGELYKQKREIQNSSLSDSVKYNRVEAIQEQINSLARNSLNSYENVRINGDYATVGDLHYRWYEPGEESSAEAGWQKISGKQLEKQEEVTSGLGISASEYWSNKEEYDYAYEYPEKYAVAKSVGGYEAYKTYSSELYDIKADKDSSGKSISGSRKKKVADYINNLDIGYEEKIILFKSEYNADDTYNNEIIDYLNNRDDISYEEMEAILKELGFTVKADGTISW